MALTQYLAIIFQHHHLSLISDEISRRDVLQPSDSSENDQQMSNFDQGSEIDGELNTFLFLVYTFQEKNKIIKTPPYQFFVE